MGKTGQVYSPSAETFYVSRSAAPLDIKSIDYDSLVTKLRKGDIALIKGGKAQHYALAVGGADVTAGKGNDISDIAANGGAVPQIAVVNRGWPYNDVIGANKVEVISPGKSFEATYDAQYFANFPVADNKFANFVVGSKVYVMPPSTTNADGVSQGYLAPIANVSATNVVFLVGEVIEKDSSTLVIRFYAEPSIVTVAA